VQTDRSVPAALFAQPDRRFLAIAVEVADLGSATGTEPCSRAGERINSLISALGVFSDATGSAMYAGGKFSAAGVTPASWIAQ